MLLRATDLATNSGFSTTRCAYKPNPLPDVKVTGVPGNGTGSITWNTETLSAFLLVGVGLVWAILSIRLLKSPAGVQPSS